jgi:hypothetical protein
MSSTPPASTPPAPSTISVIGSVVTDALADYPEILALIAAVEAGVKALPPVTPTSPRKISDITALAATVLPQIGALADKIESQVAAL